MTWYDILMLSLYYCLMHSKYLSLYQRLKKVSAASLALTLSI